MLKVKRRFPRRFGWIAALGAGALGVYIAFPGLSVTSMPVASARAVETGQMLFEHQWTPNDPLAQGGGDGLGPVFNAKSCATCHLQGGIGGAGKPEHRVVSFSVHPTPSIPHVTEGVIHASSLFPQFQENDKVVRTLYPIVPNGITVSAGCSTRQEDFDPVRYELIDTPALWGAGLIDQISSRRIMGTRLARTFAALGGEFKGDFSASTGGRVRRLKDGRVGKFGWKAQFATVEEFVSAACANELGLGTPTHAQVTPVGMTSSDTVAPDLTQEQFAGMVAFVATLPRPEQVMPEDSMQRAVVIHGEKIFASAGCAGCHTPDLGGVKGLYSDLALHRLTNSESAAYGPQSVPQVPWPDWFPNLDEWRTPPLWGVADSAPYFHDGQATTLEAAILRHQGEATASLELFQGLSDSDEAALIAFLKSLKAPKAAKPSNPAQLASR